MSGYCIRCSKELIPKEWYGICEKCKLIIPDSKDAALKYMCDILKIREKNSESLHDLDQKELDNVVPLSDLEKEISQLWKEHNSLYIELELFLRQYNKSSILENHIYPLLYLYVQVSEQIKEVYKE
jgi:hypothetical protein